MVDHSQDEEFRELLAAGVALIVYADGELNETTHERFSNDPLILRIEGMSNAMERMIHRAGSFSGRQLLWRDIDIARGTEACEDVCSTISRRMTDPREVDMKMMTQIAKRLGVYAVT